MQSPSDTLYLNCGFNPGCAYVSWQDVYAVALSPDSNTAADAASSGRVLGAEAVLFGEFADATDVQPQVWPRAAAVAERLWSDPASASPSADTTSRLHTHRCRMVTRGVDAAPIGPGFCPGTVL